jgi:biopolymer transport protein ExbD
MKLTEEPDLPPKINILPMIDVIFAILVFFIVSSLYLTRSEGLPVNLPRASTGEVQKTKQITISLDNRGKLTVDGKSTQIEELEAQIKKLMSAESSTIAIINADKVVEYGRVVEVMDRLRQIPKVQLAIAVKQKTDN